mmetsp:Transcript_14484/g.31487  ORF Transcript_14484/g.31487 Transcript_14484/m.31487 type:complete len:233 (-) Transcript_14484:4-702(-)
MAASSPHPSRASCGPSMARSAPLKLRSTEQAALSALRFSSITQSTWGAAAAAASKSASPKLCITATLRCSWRSTRRPPSSRPSARPSARHWTRSAASASDNPASDARLPRESAASMFVWPLPNSVNTGFLFDFTPSRGPGDGIAASFLWALGAEVQACAASSSSRPPGGEAGHSVLASLAPPSSGAILLQPSDEALQRPPLWGRAAVSATALIATRQLATPIRRRNRRRGSA